MNALKALQKNLNIKVSSRGKQGLKLSVAVKLKEKAVEWSDEIIH